MSARTKFLLFVFVLATIMGVATTLGSGWAAGLRSFLIVFGFWVVINLTRSERFAQLRAGDRHDERQAQIGIESMAVSGAAVVLTALVGGVFELADGRSGPFSLLCAVGGASFLLAQLLLPRWR